MDSDPIREFATVNVVKGGVIVEQSLFLLPAAKGELIDHHRQVLASFIPESVHYTKEDWARIRERKHAKGTDGTVVQIVAGELGNDYYSLSRIVI